VISDTHGLLRPEALAALAGVVHILHAGDVGEAAVLAALGRVAPVTAVRGNNDRGAWAERLPERTTVVLGDTRFTLPITLARLSLGPGGVTGRIVELTAIA